MPRHLASQPSFCSRNQVPPPQRCQMHSLHRRHHHSGSQSGPVPQAHPAGSGSSTQSGLRDPPGQAPRGASAIRGVSGLSSQLGQDAVPSASAQDSRSSSSNSFDSSSVSEGSALRSSVRIPHRQDQLPTKSSLSSSSAHLAAVAASLQSLQKSFGGGRRRSTSGTASR